MNNKLIYKKNNNDSVTIPTVLYYLLYPFWVWLNFWEKIIHSHYWGLFRSHMFHTYIQRKLQKERETLDK